MPRSEPVPVVLQFASREKSSDPVVQADISAIVQTGDDFWVASDETCTLERLSRKEDHLFSDHCAFPLEDYLELPAGPGEEVDIEGLSVSGHYLWLTGSHGLKREKPQAKTPKKAIRKLARMVRETNRFLIARIPITQDPSTSRYNLRKECADPDHPERTLKAAQLFGTGTSDVLVGALRDDEHLGRFLAIPAKENGFDIEGIAVLDDRIFLGLRGPVLRGWAVILEIQIAPISDSFFTLQRSGPKGALYRKHFLNLCGLGVRDLVFQGRDLLILAGPTMDLDGNVLLYRWKQIDKLRKQVIVGTEDLELVLNFDFRDEPERGHNHAEGVTLYRKGKGKPSLLVVYDNPGKDRRKGDNGIIADAFPL